MSTAGSGGSAATAPQFALLGGSAVALSDGNRVDLSTEGGVQVAQQALAPEDFNELKALMLELGHVFDEATGLFSPKDRLRKRQVMLEEGPSDSKRGRTALEEELYERSFKPLGLPDPFNAATTPALEAQLRNTQEFSDAVAGFETILVNPSQAQNEEFAQRMRALEAAQPAGNIMEILFLVFKEGIEQSNEDKKYFLQKLQDYNNMSEKLSNYLDYLVDLSQDLSELSEGKEYPNKVFISGVQRSFDLGGPTSDGGLKEISKENRRYDRSALSDEMKRVESDQEVIRNKRQMASTSFQNFDQKVNQQYNLVASVMKALSEMRMSPVRNFL